jgi:signal transduction histidine kinase
MNQTLIETYFAPAERAPKQKITSDSNRICSTPFLTSGFEAMPQIVFVLNEQRQIVFANKAFYDAFDVDNTDAVLGLRPGEAISCCHSDDTSGGCGTSKNCKTCGAVIAILNSLEHNTDIQECRIIRKKDNQALDLQVKATSFETNGEQFVIVSAVDISHEKRRRVLERLFFHDITNTIFGLKGVSELLSDLIPKRLKKKKSLALTICDGVSDLTENINIQKDLINAEKNELIVTPIQINSRKVLQEIDGIYKRHPVTKDHGVEVCLSTQDIDFESDITLLRRSIGNLTKNAIEASGDGDVVTVGCNMENDGIRFWVHNPAVMPEEIQLQVFQRSFSTKGKDRGLGTYSVKLLVEKYLKGNVSFTSNMEDGTTFNLYLPLCLESTSNKA